MSVMRKPMVGGELLPDGARRLILGWDTFSPEQEQRIRIESAILKAKILCVERGLLTGEELSNYDWTVSEEPMTPEDLEAIARQSETTAQRNLGPCQRCGRPTIRPTDHGLVQHMAPSGHRLWRTCRAASKEWIPREFGKRGPTWDESLDQHWVATPPDNWTDTRALLVSEPLSDDGPAVPGNRNTSVGPKAIMVVTRTRRTEGIR